MFGNNITFKGICTIILLITIGFSQVELTIENVNTGAGTLDINMKNEAGCNYCSDPSGYYNQASCESLGNGGDGATWMFDATIDAATCVGECSTGTYTSESLCEDEGTCSDDTFDSETNCEDNGGTWTPYTWTAATINGVYFDGDVAGFQFFLKGITITDASGGTAEEYLSFTNSSEITGMAIGFSLTGGVISANDSVLTTVTFSDYDGGEICFVESGCIRDVNDDGTATIEYDVTSASCDAQDGEVAKNLVSDSDALAISADWGNCWCGSAGGDQYWDDCGVCAGLDYTALCTDGSCYLCTEGDPEICTGMDCSGVCDPDTPVGVIYESLQSLDDELVDYGTALVDNCDVCGGDNSSCCPAGTTADCAGVCGGDATTDYCDACVSGIFDCVGGCDGSKVVGCDDVCDSGAVVGCDDICGSGLVNGCDDVCDSGTTTDSCGICDADVSNDDTPLTGTCDCAGTPDGDAVEDCAGECGGSATDYNGDEVAECGELAISQIGFNLPEEFSISQNFPNPFNPITSIIFDVAEMDEVSLVVYDLTGKEVATLVSGTYTPGTYNVEWNAVNNAGDGIVSGMYIYRYISSEKAITRKMLYLK